jgi:hypothetical protein
MMLVMPDEPGDVVDDDASVTRGSAPLDVRGFLIERGVSPEEIDGATAEGVLPCWCWTR